MVALEVLKAGAGELGPFLTETLHLDGVRGALGFGWLLAYAVLGGSPVAATAVTLYVERVIDAFEAFAMIAGSRLGAAFVVLLIGFVYHLRRRRPAPQAAETPFRPEQGTSLEMGVLSLLVTFAIYLPALPLGFALLRSGLFRDLRFSPPRVLDLVDVATTPVVAALERFLPAAGLFLAGLALLVLALRLFDRALPDLTALRARTAVDRVYKPVVTFALGFAVTLVTLSVSVSLGLLVPLAAKGYARRENVIPYIMGANVSTFIDTLFASILLSDPGLDVSAAAIVLAEICSVAILSLGIILLAYRRFEHALLRLTRVVLRSRASLTVFVVVILVVPVFLIIL